MDSALQTLWTFLYIGRPFPEGTTVLRGKNINQWAFFQLLILRPPQSIKYVWHHYPNPTRAVRGYYITHARPYHPSDDFRGHSEDFQKLRTFPRRISRSVAFQSFTVRVYVFFERVRVKAAAPVFLFTSAWKIGP